jgi:hypothetical protein
VAPRMATFRGRFGRAGVDLGVAAAAAVKERSWGN